MGILFDIANLFNAFALVVKEIAIFVKNLCTIIDGIRKIYGSIKAFIAFVLSFWDSYDDTKAMQATCA